MACEMNGHSFKDLPRMADGLSAPSLRCVDSTHGERPLEHVHASCQVELASKLEGMGMARVSSSADLHLRIGIRRTFPSAFAIHSWSFSR